MTQKLEMYTDYQLNELRHKDFSSNFEIRINLRFTDFDNSDDVA